MTDDEIEDQVINLGLELMRFSCSQAGADGKRNALIFAMAAADVIGSDASLLPGDVAQAMLDLTVKRMRRNYELGLQVGGPIQ